MAIKPRIHWAWDGTIAYLWAAGTGSDYNLKGEVSAPNPNVIDGDEFSADYYTNGWNGYAFQFADLIKIHSMKLRRPLDNCVINAWVSDEDAPTDYDPINNIYGEWSQIVDTQVIGTALRYTEIAAEVLLNCKWLLLKASANWNGTRCIHIFGEYVAPRFEFWNVGETAELNTLQIPLVMPNAPNIQNYNEYLPFKLKNTHTETHDYNLTVKKVKYGVDPTISNNYTLGISPGFVKSTTIAIEDLVAGDWSDEIRVFADVLKADNPADGLHYFVIDVTETA